MLTISGIEFEPNEQCRYRNSYWNIAKDIKDGKKHDISAYRWLILNDLFFVVYFVIGQGKANYKKINHPFIVDACNEIQDGLKDATLDVWAREHLKSSCITIGETLQEVLKNPNSSTCIFSYARPVAKKFLFELKELFERNELLRTCFPDIIWDNPSNQAPIWSLDDGLILNRKGNRKEPTIYASGLIEGMPTGMHFDRMIFDDIVTEDIAESVDVMEKVKTKIDSAMNLGMDGGTHRIVGTFYHHNDPLVYVKKKKDNKGNSVYHLRFKPATKSGSPNETPLFISQERFDFLKTTKTFYCQQLLNPTPQGTQSLNNEFMKEVDILPNNLYKFMVIDSAGEGTGKDSDSWAIHVVGVEPKTDDIGASNVYVLDSCITPMGTSEAIEQIVRMYIANGSILKVGIEKAGLSTTEIHVANALKARGRHISVDSGSLVLLKPAGRTKEIRIESSLAWALNNGKIFLYSKIPFAYKNKLRNEMSEFPYGHDDGVDALSYVYDIMKDYNFNYKKSYRHHQPQMVNMV